MTRAESQRLARLRPKLERRALVYHHTREFFRKKGFLEVETPLRMAEVAPEQHIVPIGSEGWFLSTSPELHMKRLLASGYDKIFQFGRCFRRGERGRWHNPEFTLLEWYRQSGDYRQMISDASELVAFLAERLMGSRCLHYQGQVIDLSLPWLEITVGEAFHLCAGWDPVASPDPVRFDDDLVGLVMPGFPKDRPVALLDYPAALGSLARLKPDDPQLAERAEVFIGGLELANAFSELVDAGEQERRFRAEIEQIKCDTGRKAAMPRKFLRALGDMPPSGGIALGMDRLVMLFCDAASIDEVLPFTVDDI
jgi:lysyl-tRNA synthetase class 2